MSSSPSLLNSDLAFAYVTSDIPEGMTVLEWRRARRAAEAEAEAASPARRRLRRAPRLRFA